MHYAVRAGVSCQATHHCHHPHPPAALCLATVHYCSRAGVNADVLGLDVAEMPPVAVFACISRETLANALCHMLVHEKRYLRRMARPSSSRAAGAVVTTGCVAFIAALRHHQHSTDASDTSISWCFRNSGK
jgi:hypothetical protein